MTMPQHTEEVKGHRVSSLKPQNKKHHTIGHKSKRFIVSLNKGKVNDNKVKKKAKVGLTKLEKKNQHNQKRKHKTDETIKCKRSLGTNDAAPFLILIVPMSENITSHRVLDALCTGDPGAIVDYNLEGVTHVGCKRFRKRLSFIAPSALDRTSIMDAAKASDSVLFVWDANQEDMMEEEMMLLTIMKSQGLPTVIHAISGLDDLSQKKKLRALKELKKEINVAFPEQSKVFNLDNKQETLLLLRQLAEQKKHEIFFRDKRSHILAEEVEFVEEKNSEGTLKISGYIRGQSLSPNNIIHIPGWENYHIECIEGLEDPHPMGKPCFTSRRFGAGEREYPQPSLQRPLCSTQQVKATDLDDTTEEEVTAGAASEEVLDSDDYETDDPSDEGSVMDLDSFDEWEDEDDRSWIDMDSNDQSEDEGDRSLITTDNEASEVDDVTHNDQASDIDDQGSYIDDDNYDSHMDYEAEMNSLREAQAQEVEDNKNFPDEVDTPFEETARNRFSKYRGMESFRTSPWEDYDDAPLDMKRIFDFKAYNNLRRSIFKAEQTGVEAGSYVRVHLKNVSKRVYEEHVESNVPIVMFSLLEKEEKMSMLNVLLKSHGSGHLEAIKSKEKLIFHIGFRRFTNCPIFSEHTSCNKFLFLRYFHPKTTVMASMFAPVIFSPCPVSVFIERMDGTQDLVATGTVYSVDNRRTICKRICLSGHPFKIKPNVTVVRYMFFNREDIEFFKKIKVHSKCGARGKIIGPVGTHGHMKCFFKGKLTSQDVIFLTLYKRVYPKWKYEPLVHRLRNTHSDYVSDDGECSDREEPQAKKQKRVQFTGDC